MTDPQLGDKVVNPAWPDRVMEIIQILTREGIAQCQYTEPDAPRVRRAFHALNLLEKP